MWCIGSTFVTFLCKSKFIWNFSTVEGDSPVDYVDFEDFVFILE